MTRRTVRKIVLGVLVAVPCLLGAYGTWWVVNQPYFWKVSIFLLAVGGILNAFAMFDLKKYAHDTRAMFYNHLHQPHPGKTPAERRQFVPLHKKLEH